MHRIIPATMRRPSSFPAALSFVLALAFLAQCSAFVLRPTPLAAASLRRQPHTVSKALEPSPLFTRLCAPAAAAAAPVAPVGGSGSGLLPRLKSMAQNVVTGLPVVALSTISGGFLAGSLHSVTGTYGFLCLHQLLYSNFHLLLCVLCSFHLTQHTPAQRVNPKHQLLPPCFSPKLSFSTNITKHLTQKRTHRPRPSCGALASVHRQAMVPSPADWGCLGVRPRDQRYYHGHGRLLSQGPPVVLFTQHAHTKVVLVHGGVDWREFDYYWVVGLEGGGVV